MPINQLVPVDANRLQIGVYCFQDILSEVTTKE